jgi:S1-C subfamily serine protease
MKEILNKIKVKIFTQPFLKIFLAVSLVVTSGASTFLYVQNTQLREDAGKFYEVQERAEVLELEKVQLSIKLNNLNNLNASLNFNLNKTSTDLNKLTELNFSLTNTIKELELENTELVDSIVSMTKEIEDLNKKVKALSVGPIYGGGGGGSYSAPTAPNISSNIQDPALLAEIEQLKTDLKIAVDQKVLLQTQLNQLDILVKTLENNINTSAETAVILNATIETLTQEKIDLESELNLLTNERELLDLLDAEKAEVNRLDALITEKNGTISTLTAEKDKLLSDNAKLVIDYNNLVEQKNSYKILNDSLNISLSNLNIEIDGYKADIIKLNSDIEGYKTQVINLNKDIDDYKLIISTNTTRIKELEDLIKVHLSTITELEGNKESLLSQIQYYIDTTGPKIDFDTLNTISQLAVKANVRIEVGNSIGSGVVYKRVTVGNSYEFYILTNYHVINNHIKFNSTINVKNYAGINKTGTLMAAQFYKSEILDVSVDLAVIKVTSSSISEYYVLDLAPSAYVYNSNTVISVGNPRSQWNTITVGSVISANENVMINLDGTFRVFSNVVLHSALIDSGNSGGAILNTNLQIVGLNFAGNPQTNVFPFQSVNGYAIEIKRIHLFLDAYNLK